MEIGKFGDIVFSVSGKKLETFSNLKRSMKAKYSTHSLHNTGGRIEFTGRDPEELSLNITLAANLGVDIFKEIDKLRINTARGYAYPLYIGKRKMGDYKWVITGFNLDYKYFDKRGKPVVVDASVSFKEYLK